MPNRSTATNLVVFQNDIISSFKSHTQTDAIYLDFSKAFDKVSHAHLISKLRAHGIHGALLDWFQSYLQNRQLRVRFAGSYSKNFTATSGVPQGSHLGPILFNIFVNDISEVIKVKHLLFADDIKLYTRILSYDDCLLLQQTLCAVETWCNDNYMSLNAKKCVVVSFSRSHEPVHFRYRLNDSILERRSNVKDLGITLASNLSSSLHVERACASASKNLGMVTRFSRSLSSPLALKSLYYAYIRPHLEYCSIVWSPHQQYLIDEIERIQERFLHLVGLRLGLGYREAPLNDLAALLGLQPLQSRRMLQDIIFLYRILNGLIDCPEILSSINLRVPTGTRSNDIFGHLHHATNYEKHSTINRIQRLGNFIAADVDFFYDKPTTFRRTALVSLNRLGL